MGSFLKFVVPRECLPKIGGLRPDKEVVLLQDLLFGQPVVLVGICLKQQVLGLSLTVVKVRGDDPLADLEKERGFGSVFWRKNFVGGSVAKS